MLSLTVFVTIVFFANLFHKEVLAFTTTVQQSFFGQHCGQPTVNNIERRICQQKSYYQSSSLLHLSQQECETQLSTIASIDVMTLNDEKVPLGTLIGRGAEEGKSTTIVSCLSHFGDFNAWEVTQQYIASLSSSKKNDDNGNNKIVLIGIGSVSSAQKFADDLDLLNNDQIVLVADETGAVTEALNCYRGWLAVDKQHAKKWPATNVNPYIKLFGMIFGLGSPGTMQKVLYGYVGEKDSGKVSSRKWVVDALLSGSNKGRFPQITEQAFDNVPQNSGLRPFELATLRAQTGIHIVLNWNKFGPKDGELFTRMGGTFVFNNSNDDGNAVCVYEYFDKGILSYAPIDEVIAKYY